MFFYFIKIFWFLYHVPFVLAQYNILNSTKDFHFSKKAVLFSLLLSLAEFLCCISVFLTWALYEHIFPVLSSIQ